MKMLCDVCGDETGLDSDFCESCGAILPETFGEATDEIATPDAPLPDPMAELPVIETELLSAFRNQFEQNQVQLPQKWSEKLRHLAFNVELGRRFASIFFVDLRGYTALSRILPEEQLDELRQWFYSLVTRRVEQYGGFVIQFAGDAVFAAFGAPWAFERDSESALQALLDIREDIRRKGQYAGHPLAIRAGSDFGPVNVRTTDVQGRQTPDLFGSTVNLSARLEAQADTWEILISDTMATQVGSVFELEPRTPFVPKNYGREVTPYAVIQHKGQDAVRRVHHLPYVGREYEMRQILTAANNVSAGQFETLHITGDAGMGKTRLVRESMQHPGFPEFSVARVDCEPHFRFAFLHTLKIAIKHWIIQQGKSEAETLEEQDELSVLHNLLPNLDTSIVPTLGYVFGHHNYVAQLSSIPTNILKQQIEAALVSLIRTIAGRQRLLLLIDDFQWADLLTFQILCRVINEQPGNVLVILIGRDSFDEELFAHEEQNGDNQPGLIGKIRQAATNIRLSPLTPEQCEAIASSSINWSNLDLRVRERILAESEGIPLYVIEIASELAERASAVSGEFLADTASAIGNLALPNSILNILQARLDRLTREQRAVLQCGATLGRKFSYKVISLYETLREDLLSELYALKGIALLRDQAELDDILFAFNPTALRNVAYSLLTAQQRKQLHRAIATAIEKHYPNRLDDFLYDLAYHWVRAEDLNHGRRYIRRAVQAALKHGAPQEAYSLVKRALSIAATNDTAAANDLVYRQQQALLEEGGGKACRLIGDFDKSREHFTAFLEIASSIQNEGWVANARFQLAANNLELGNLDDCEAVLEELRGRKTTPADLLVRVANVLGIVFLRKGRLNDALSEFQWLATDPSVEQNAIASKGDGLSNAGLVYWHLGQLDKAEECFNEAHSLYSDLKNPFGQASALCNTGIVLEKKGDFRRAIEVYDKAHSIAESVGYLHGLSAIETNRSNIFILLLEWKDAQLASAKALKYAELIQHRHSQATALNNLALACGGAGNIADAEKYLDESDRMSSDMNDPIRVASALLARVWVHLQNNQWDTARAIHQRLTAERFTESHTLPMHLAEWHETNRLALDFNADGLFPAAFEMDGLREYGNESTVENLLRRLDMAAQCATATDRDTGGYTQYRQAVVS